MRTNPESVRRDERSGFCSVDEQFDRVAVVAEDGEDVRRDGEVVRCRAQARVHATIAFVAERVRRSMRAAYSATSVGLVDERREDLALDGRRFGCGREVSRRAARAARAREATRREVGGVGRERGVAHVVRREPEPGGRVHEPAVALLGRRLGAQQRVDGAGGLHGRQATLGGTGRSRDR